MKFEQELTRFTAILLSTQIVHLVWLTTDVVFGLDIFTGYLKLAVIAVDFIELPALGSGILLGIVASRKNKWELIGVALLATQPIHIFWITDDVIFETLIGGGFVAMPFAFIVAAIAIDYLEIPVIINTLWKWVKIKEMKK